MCRAVFLDRDGTINVDVGYLHKPSQVVFIEGVVPALAKLRQMGYRLIVISNQSGIGRGYYSAQEVEILHQYMNQILEKQGAGIDAFYYCPHLESDGCICRKPQTGLIERAAREWQIDMRSSYMVGDKESDIQTAKNAGCGYGLLLCGHPVSPVLQRKYQGHIYLNLWEFVQTLKQ